MPTYGGDTVLTMPRQSAEGEGKLLSRLAHEFMNVQFNTAEESTLDRRAKVIEELKKLEQSGLGQLVDDQ